VVVEEVQVLVPVVPVVPVGVEMVQIIIRQVVLEHLIQGEVEAVEVQQVLYRVEQVELVVKELL
jgi:hypothetical protein